jgi:hypothetical protein
MTEKIIWARGVDAFHATVRMQKCSEFLISGTIPFLM